MTSETPESDDELARHERAVSRLTVPEERLPTAPVKRVRKAYEQVYDQLRDLIMRGELSRGERLPNEAVLAREFGVSRGTVREALRVLAAQNLIRTAKGAGGGSFVTLPTVDHISSFLHANISLLSESEDVTLQEFLEARELLEVFAARQCAVRRTPGDLERMRDTIIEDPAKLGTEEHFVYNKEFHSAVLDGCGNTLLCIAAQPVFSVLQTNLARDAMSQRFAKRINEDHRAILAAIEDGDAEAAAEQMQRHLAYLSRTYQKMWRQSTGVDGD
ncbi:Putative L-lactate dehydrogenase operon regulatory protein [Capillimicrobium parvum]|uniref:L-lactate dehydrogenase operon regulatory protein n=1 Tax=Capillimicrobium parvum TaxID=2884022 RepID=A0A9E6Y6G2_9ACTN|nr:Putative L-lactate dehydrogenase operon regulatory protein [Capillimicrobium parvum]